MEQARGGFALAWLLLVFLGPLGWLVLLFVVAAGSARRDVLSVRLPYAEAAVDHEIRVRRLRLIGGLTAVASVVLALALAAGDEMSPPVLVVCGLVGVAAVVCAAVQHVRLTLTRVGIELDASRRWVRLSRVHPDFVRAVEAAEAEAAAAERSGMRA